MSILPGCGHACRASTHCWRHNFGEQFLRELNWLCLVGLVFLAPATKATVPLVQINPALYQTEHCLFVIDASVNWSSSSTAFSDIYTYPFPKLNDAYDKLVAQFPGTYFSVCYIANTGNSTVPNYIDRTAKASGINESSAVGTPNTFATTDMCRYNLSGGSVSKSMLAVYDHELGHAWGARAFYNTSPYPSLSNGHWLSNTTIDCQMSATYSADGSVTVNKLYGDPTNGFHWQKVDNLHSNDTETFSEQALYLIGLRKTWPTTYLLNSPVYNADGTASYSTVDTLAHADIVAAYGARNPDYTTEQKRLKVGFVYIARDLAEVNAVYQNAELSVDQFCNGEAIDTTNYRFQTPFLANTKYRASVDGLLADLNGNSTPTLTVTDTYVTSSDGAAVVNFVAADPDGAAPTVSVVPASSACAIVGSTVQISGLPDGVHFFTLKTVDAGGKKVFGHFIVEVQRPASSTAISSQPLEQTITSGNSASFSVTATGTPASFTYQWYRQAAGQSIWNTLSDGGAYTGSVTATLNVVGSTTMNGDKFLCVVSNATGTVTSNDALLMVNETAPVLSTQPVDRAVPTGNSVSYTVVAVGIPSTYGYFYYQWQRLAAGSGTWTDLSNGGGYTGATTASLSVASNLTMSGDQFRCVVTNTAGVATSNVASLTVGSVPTITTQPVSPITISAGQSASFSVTASGTAPLAYQWARYGVPVAGATSATLSITNAQSADAGAYTVDVTNAYGLGRSNVGSLTVTSAAPAVSTQPQSASVIAGQGVSFSVIATGTSPFTYQWKKGGVSVSGATSATLTLSNVQNGDAGSYTVVVTNSVSSTTSAAATLTVNAKTMATVVLGSLSATYDGSAHAATATTTPASLAFDLTYNGSATAPTNAGTYVVVGTINDATYQGSSSGNLIIAKITPVITWSAPAAIVSGTALSSTQLNATANVAGSFVYNPASGTVPSVGTLSLSAAFTPADTTNYNSTSLQQSIVINVAPVFTTQPVNQTVNHGQNAAFSVVANGSPAPTYQWQIKAAGSGTWFDLSNSGAYSGANTATLLIANATLAMNGDQFRCLVTNSAGVSTSNVGLLTVTTGIIAPSGAIISFTIE